MKRSYFYVLVSIAILSLLIIFFFVREKEEAIPSQDYSTNPISPFDQSIFGVGIVEASSQNIRITAQAHRIIEKIPVEVGSTIKQGEVLIQFENRDLQSHLAVEKLKYDLALAEIKRLKALPQEEVLKEALAQSKLAKIRMQEALEEYERVQSLQDPRAIGIENLNKRKFNYEKAQAKVEESEAYLTKIQKGVWQPDLEIAELKALQARATLDNARIEIQRTEVVSPIDGEVLQVNLHEGELATNDPIMIIGNTDSLHLRVSINQYEAPYFAPHAEAVAYLQGDTNQKYTLEFVKTEPYLISKTDRTYDITEKVDTRILQVIYRFKEKDSKLYVGEQMDVFIKADFPENYKHA